MSSLISEGLERKSSDLCFSSRYFSSLEPTSFFVCLCFDTLHGWMLFLLVFSHLLLKHCKFLLMSRTNLHCLQFLLTLTHQAALSSEQYFSHNSCWSDSKVSACQRKSSPMISLKQLDFKLSATGLPIFFLLNRRQDHCGLKFGSGFNQHWHGWQHCHNLQLWSHDLSMQHQDWQAQPLQATHLLHWKNGSLEHMLLWTC